MLTNYSEKLDHFSNKLILTSEKKLKKELDEAVKLQVEFIIISINSSPKEEIQNIRDLLKQFNGTNTCVIVKIDSSASIQLFNDYIEYTDGIYFSRNDLILKDNLSKICYYQKSIKEACNILSKSTHFN